MTTRITFFSDFICPYCYVAETATLSRVAEDWDVEVDWRPFQLHPATPQGGMRLADLFGASGAEAARDRFLAFAATFGMGDMVLPERLPNTAKVLTMAEYARDQGALDGFRSAALKAYWQRGEDLGDDQVLRTLATEAGLDAEAALTACVEPALRQRMLHQREVGSQLGLRGVPYWLFDTPEGLLPVSGCQPLSVIEQALGVAGAELRS